MPRRAKRVHQMQANRLQSALATGTHHPATDSMVAVADMLAPNVPIRSDHHDRTKAMMLRAAAEAFAGPSHEVPAQTSGGPTVHVVEVETPEGKIRLADVEPIDQERATEAAADIANLDRYTGDR